MTENATPTRRIVLIALAVFVVILLAFGVRALTRTRLDVRVSTVSRNDMTNFVSTNGLVEPVQDYQAHAPGPGTVQTVYISVGEHVRNDQLLIRMEDSDARSRVASAKATLDSSQLQLNNLRHGGSADENLAASSDLTSARAQLAEATAAQHTTEQLAAKGSASPNEVSNSRQKVADAQARVSQLEARRTGRYSAGDISAQQSQVAQASAAYSASERAISAYEIRAPFAGTVYSLPVSETDYVAAGQELLNLADLDHIQVRGFFDEPDVAKLQAGQPVKIVWEAKPGKFWHGHISRLPMTITTYGQTRHVGEVLIAIDDPSPDLLPNITVTITVTTAQKMDVRTIPREALHTDGLRNYVFVLQDGKLHAVNVSVGSTNLLRAEITGGLSDGQQVVLNATHNEELTDGAAARVAP